MDMKISLQLDQSMITWSLFFLQWFSLNPCTSSLPEVLCIEPLFLLKKLGIKREKFHSVPGCGDINAEMYFTATHVSL